MVDETQKFTVGPLTLERVFKASGMTNLSDMQGVLDQMEVALSGSIPAQVEPAEPVDAGDG